MSATNALGFECPRVPYGEPFKFGLAQWRNDQTCSGCGSLSEQAFLEAVCRGEEIGPTDKNYKVYVGNRHKFYFQHLSPEGRKTFIELFNAGLMKVGMPGHFYVLPFFCVRWRIPAEAKASSERPRHP